MSDGGAPKVKAFGRIELSSRIKYNHHIAIWLTSLVHVTFGTGFPDAMHSSITSTPFLITILPSAGFDRTRGGTEK